MEPMLSAMTALCTRREAVMTGRRTWKNWSRLSHCGDRLREGAGAEPALVHAEHSSRQRSFRPLREGPPFSSIIGRRQLHHQGRNPVLHPGTRHRVDHLVGDAVVILSSKMRLAPEVLELYGVQRLADFLRIEALRLLHGSDKCEGGGGEVDARGIPLAVLLGIARLPTLHLLGPGALHKPVHPHPLDIRLAGDVRHPRGVDLSDVNEAPLEAEFATWLDDHA